MAVIYPIPTGRSSDMLVTHRLLAQLQTAQKRLLTVQQQLSTGRRIQLASEDAAAASRAISVQRILETKQQLKTNLSTSQSYLNATDTALSNVADLLSNARGLAVRAADSTTSQSEREAMALEIQATINQLLDVGNEQFRGRYLFAGSDSTTRPFESYENYIAYVGNNTSLRTYANQGVLFDTNMPGQELFGAISTEVQGIDLDPVLTSDTRLADLRGGLGITAGTLIMSDGSHTSTVSLAGAETIGDVAQRLESNPPEGREIHVTVGARGLRVEIDAAGGGSFTIRDEKGGRTAAQLGILRLSGRAVDPIEGADLDPIVRATTSLDNILGVRASATVRSSGSDNDIILEARERGAAFNDVTLQFVDHNLLQAAPGLQAGAEYAEFDTTARAAQAGLRLSGLDNDLIIRATTAGSDWNNIQIQLDASLDLGNTAQATYSEATRTLTLQVDDTDQTMLGTLVAAINATGQFAAVADPSKGEGYDPTAAVLASDAGRVGDTGNSGGEANTLYVYIDANATSANQAIAALGANSDIDAMFAARIDPQDSTSAALGGSRPVDVAEQGVTAGGSGIEWDQDSGLQITNGDETYVINFQTAETVQDLLNILNSSGAMVLAEINEDRTGINVRSRLSGADFSIGENGGSTATDLGIRSLTRDTLLSALNYRQGVNTVDGADFTIRRNDGVELAIDVSSARTVGDVIDLINNHPDNLDPSTAVTAQLRAYGNGLELIDDNPTGTDSLQVSRTNLSLAAWDLGLIPRGAETSLSPDPPGTLSGSDTNPIETQGVFNSLIRLRDAVEDFDVTQIERIVTMLDEDYERLSFGRAEIGARGQSLDAITTRNEDEQVELKAVLSEEIDVDLAQAASDFAARQAAYEAAIRSIANLYSLSLLDFL